MKPQFKNRNYEDAEFIAMDSQYNEWWVASYVTRAYRPEYYNSTVELVHLISISPSGTEQVRESIEIPVQQDNGYQSTEEEYRNAVDELENIYYDKYARPWR